MSVKIIKQSCFILLVIYCFSCGSGGQVNTPLLTVEQKLSIESFNQILTNSFNTFDHSLVNAAWNEKAFKARMTSANKVKKAVFEHIFDKDIKGKLKYESLLLMNRLNSGNGKAVLVKSDHADFYSESTLAFVFEEHFDFVKFRIQMIENKPYLVDFYSFKDNLWYSERAKNFVNLSTQYRSNSPERQKANLALGYSDQSLKSRDTLSALEYLYDIPSSYWVGNGLSSRRLNLAAALGDSVYQSALATEFEENKSPYIRYLYHRHMRDSIGLDAVYKSLSDLTGAAALIDSLTKNNSFWN